MSELYKRHRPTCLADLVGAEDLRAYISAQIGNPAYDRDSFLIVGASGSGKTSAARVIAAMLTKTDFDIHEIDSAATGRLEDVRELRLELRIAAWAGGWKVYIVDEAHNLSDKAKEGFLKVTEDLPAKRAVIFTSDRPNVFRSSLLSRVKKFYLERPTEGALREVLMKAARAEGWTMPEAMIRLAALRADGNFRSAFQELETAHCLGDSYAKHAEQSARAEGRRLTPAVAAGFCPKCGNALPLGKKYCNVRCYLTFLKGDRSGSVAVA